MADVIKVGPNGVQIPGGFGGLGGLIDAAKGLMNRKTEPSSQAPEAADTTIYFNQQSGNAAILEGYMKKNGIKRDPDGKLTLSEAKAFKAHIDKKLGEISNDVVVTAEGITLNAVAVNALGLKFKGDAQPAAPAQAASKPAPAQAGAAEPTGEAAKLEKLAKEGGFMEKISAQAKLDFICLAQGEKSEHYDSGVCTRVKADAATRGNKGREQ